MLMPELDAILMKCKQALQDLYGERFAGLVLYGSMARGDYNAESDIDLLVLLNGEVDPIAEIGPLVDATEPIQTGCDRLISVRAASLGDYLARRLAFLSAVREEALSL